MDNYDDYPAAEPIPEPQNFHSELMRFLIDHQGMQKTAKSALKQSLYAGSGALAGSLLGGATGGLIGGVVGSIIGYARADDYDGVVSQLSKLNSQQQRFLMMEVKDALMKAGANPAQLQSTAIFRDTILEYAKKDSVRNNIWKACISAASK
mmetsp:Transcript_12536/g.13964  ORF Transcript_12536/g.13964 Transcript_12536/m.13964 type:complete len:151 (+) Transcript_12536:56-508(+)|eukprot:CAMPEP_0194141514 /NCGR_PEP_ID=MMETSP0152-20130528/10912_1 /TAXON_ID=1049557 /ORGANISM="Thalassiothrix antarctica, Strain L6-D1" /LENGTH=150 /DNA_ID=CAMNT_0038840157 /DNA_START=53 /DNA_END=505 /DNA_ORIENTATION=-